MNEPETHPILTESDPGCNILQQLFSIDLRSLALLRMLVGLIVFIYILAQFSHVELLYTDQGILPMALNRQLLGEGFWSIFWIIDSSSLIHTVLILTALAAAMLILGFQTWWMNLVCLVVVWSLQVRNPLVLTGGDVLLRMLLFWMLFLPTNVIWSMDAGRNEKFQSGNWTECSLATVAIMLQIVYMYFFAGLAKWNEYWLSGEAVSYAMQLEMSVKPLGHWLSEFPLLLQIATLATLAAELLTLVLMFIPRIDKFFRGALMGFFFLLHVGIGLTMSIGLFSVTAMVAWIVFVPSDIWNETMGQPVGFDDPEDHRRGAGWRSRLATLVGGLFLIYITLQNIVNACPPATAARFSTLEQIGRTTMAIQEFQMFAEPPLYSPWFEYPAELESGRQVDLFDPRHQDLGNKPASVYRYMQSQHWRRIHWNLITPSPDGSPMEPTYAAIRDRILRHMVDRWNRKHAGDKVLHAVANCHLEPIVLTATTIDAQQTTRDANPPQEWARYRTRSRDP